MRAVAITLGVLAAIVFLAVLVTPLFFLPFDAPGNDPEDWWRWMWGWMPMMMPFMMLFMVLFWALFLGLLALLGVWLFRQLQGQRHGNSGHALRILQERYARSEIDREEYERMRADLLHDQGG